MSVISSAKLQRVKYKFFKEFSQIRKKNSHKYFRGYNMQPGLKQVVNTSQQFGPNNSGWFLNSHRSK